MNAVRSSYVFALAIFYQQFNVFVNEGQVALMLAGV